MTDLFRGYVVFSSVICLVIGGILYFTPVSVTIPNSLVLIFIGLQLLAVLFPRSGVDK